jgi:hypothetical protein
MTMARVFIHLDSDDLLHELERQGLSPLESLTLAQHRRLEDLFAQALAGSAIREVVGDVAREAARQAGLCPDEDGRPEIGTGAALNLWPGDVAARGAC